MAIGLLERDNELAALDSALRSARSGVGRLVLIRGEPGIGKTALGMEFTRQARASGAVVLSGSADPIKRELPFAPVVQAIREHLDEQSPTSRRRLFAGLPMLGELFADDALPVIDPVRRDVQAAGRGTRRTRLFDAISQLVQRIAAASPVVCWLDDAERADQGTIELVHFLAGRLARSPLLLILTCGPASSGPGTDLESLWMGRARSGRVLSDGGGEVVTIDLGPLSPSSTDALVNNAAPLLQDGERRRIAETSAGIPAFVLAMAALPVGARGEECHRLVQDRLHGLSPLLVNFLEVLSVGGGPVPQGALEVLLERDYTEVDECCRQLIALGWIERINTPSVTSYRIARRPYADGIYRNLGDGLRRQLHARYARAMDGCRGVTIGEIAPHYLAAAALTPLDRTIQVLLAGGTAALDERRTGEAIEMFEVAVDLLDPVDIGGSFNGLRLLGEALHTAGRSDNAEGVWQRALRLVPREDERARELHSLLAIVQSDLGRIGPPSESSQVPAPPTVVPQGEPAAIDAVYRMMWTTRKGDPVGTRAIARELRAFAAAATTDAERAAAAIGVAMTAFADGDLLTSRVNGERALALSDGINGIFTGGAMRNLTRDCLLLGDLKAARAHAATSVEATRSLAPLGAVAGTLSTLGLLDLLIGDRAAAREEGGAGLRLARQVATPRVMVRCLLAQAWINVACGDGAEAAASLREAQRTGGDLINDEAHLSGVAECVQAELFLERQTSSPPPDRGAQRSEIDGIVYCMHPLLMGRVAVAQNRPDLVKVHLERLRRFGPQSPLMMGMGERLEGLLALTSGETSRAASLLAQSAEVLGDLGLAMIAAQARLEWAEVAAGQSADHCRVPAAELVVFFSEQGSRQWADRSRRLARSLGLRVPHRRIGTGTLTAREAEVATLAAAGSSNAEIAAILFVSERTVESHLRNVYGRLGIGSRIDLVRYLSRASSGEPADGRSP